MSKASQTLPTTTATWLRSLAFGLMVIGFAADRGRLLIEGTDQCIVNSKGPLYDRFGSKTGFTGIDGFFCLLLAMFREIFMFPISRATALVFASIAVPAMLNVLWRARTRTQTFKAFVLLCCTQTITFGMTAALCYSATVVPPVSRSAKGKTTRVEQAARSVSTRYVWWITILVIATQPALAALILAPVENDAVHVIANGCFQLYPIVFLLAFLVKPLGDGKIARGRHHKGIDSGRGVQLIVRLLGYAAWWSALLHWAGAAGMFILPAVRNESAYGSHNKLLSPVIASLLAGNWEWSPPRADHLGAGPIFFLLDYIASVLGVWASQIESGHPPGLGDAIIGGPAYAVAQSMAKTWSAAL